MPEYNTRKTTEYPIYMFTVCGLAHTVLSKTLKAALLSFFWTGTAPNVCQRFGISQRPISAQVDLKMQSGKTPGGVGEGGPPLYATLVAQSV